MRNPRYDGKKEARKELLLSLDRRSYRQRLR